MKIGWQLTKLLQKFIRLTFFGPPCSYSSVSYSLTSYGSMRCTILAPHQVSLYYLDYKVLIIIQSLQVFYLSLQVLLLMPLEQG